MDNIIFIDEGRIIFQGTYADFAISKCRATYNNFFISKINQKADIPVLSFDNFIFQPEQFEENKSDDTKSTLSDIIHNDNITDSDNMSKNSDLDTKKILLKDGKLFSYIYSNTNK